MTLQSGTDAMSELHKLDPLQNIQTLDVAQKLYVLVHPETDQLTIATNKTYEDILKTVTS